MTLSTNFTYLVTQMLIGHIPKLINNALYNLLVDITPELLFSDTRSIKRTTMNGVLLWSTSNDFHVQTFDIDTVNNTLYYFDENYMKRVSLDQLDDEPEIIFTDLDLTTNSIAVDWIGRYFVFVG